MPAPVAKASYSNYGANVDIAAPGGDNGAGILSTLNAGTAAPAGDNYVYYGGTSMATPHVAGVAALMLSVNPNLTPDDVETRLKATARAFPAACSGCGTGILNAAAAVDAALGSTGTTPAPTPTPTAPALNETESNNTVSTANPVTVSGTVMTGSANNSYDDDFYVVQLAAGKTLSVTVTPQSTTNFDLYVYNGAGTLVASSTLSGTSVDAVAVTNTASTTQARYVRVRYKSGTVYGTSKYQARFGW
jgi:serine protease